MKVIKRDGTTVDFDRTKIVVAIQKANEAVEPDCRVGQEQIDEIADYVMKKGRRRMLVEDIQDMVEQQIVALGRYELAKAYIIYRYVRSLARRQNPSAHPPVLPAHPVRISSRSRQSRPPVPEAQARSPFSGFCRFRFCRTRQAIRPAEQQTPGKKQCSFSNSPSFS